MSTYTLSPLHHLPLSHSNKKKTGIANILYTQLQTQYIFHHPCSSSKKKELHPLLHPPSFTVFFSSTRTRMHSYIHTYITCRTM
ncbi:unnamed protein product [Periconia digitata]|uniref:Uncharacterized protein n=1 Tax=Periconia digitata TaxID=1303443 RepID=A0A9W4XKC0_9PLEO|nr:unnamed protein product [Periconia digitata]